MGIKFFCPNGHKLNVKSFLAGRRGICPRCGIGVDIPAQSDPARLRSSKKKTQEEQEPFVFKLPADLSAGSPAGTLSGAVGSEEPEPLFPIGPAGSIAPEVAGAPAEPPTLFAGISPEGGPGSKPAPPSPAKPVAPIAAAKPVAKPASPKPGGAAAKTPAAKTPVAPAKPAAKPVGAAPPPAPPAPAAVVDPLSEAPNAVWYLRPASGGQYGPAVADMMRQWIAEGRVAGDSLVWREGWRDWRLASEVLGSLGIVQTTAPLPAAGAAPAGPETATALSVGFEELGIPREESAGQRRISSRKRFKHTQPLVIMILLLALVILLGVLIVVLANQPQSSSTNARLRPAESAEPAGAS